MRIGPAEPGRGRPAIGPTAMKNRLVPAACLPVDHALATLVGRVWSEREGGPCWSPSAATRSWGFVVRCAGRFREVIRKQRAG